MKKLSLSLSIFLYFSIYAQIPKIGSENTLEIATWNINWFGYGKYGIEKGPANEKLQLKNIKDLLDQSGFDIVALQEMSNVNYFYDLLDVTGYAGKYSDISKDQKTAIIWDPVQFKMLEANNILAKHFYKVESLPPLEVKFRGLTNKVIEEFTVLVLAFPAHPQNEKKERQEELYKDRKNAARILKNYLDTAYTDKPVIVTGDWNDDLDQSDFYQKKTPFKVLLDDPENYLFTNKKLSDSHMKSKKNGSFINHILINKVLFDSFQSSDVLVMSRYENTFFKETSDHFPVYAIFK